MSVPKSKEFTTPRMQMSKEKQSPTHCDFFAPQSKAQAKSGWGKCKKTGFNCHETDMKKCKDYSTEIMRKFWSGFAKHMSNAGVPNVK